MLFMVIERFKNRDAEGVYRRFHEKGRMLPDGRQYVDSWVEANFDRCFQLMECDDVELFQQWVAQWQDLVDFEIVQVISSKSAAGPPAGNPSHDRRSRNGSRRGSPRGGLCVPLPNHAAFRRSCARLVPGGCKTGKEIPRPRRNGRSAARRGRTIAS